jgi:hypothetical protein
MDTSAGGIHGGLARTLAASQEHQLAQSQDLTLVALAGAGAGGTPPASQGLQAASGAGQSQRGGSKGQGSTGGKQAGTSPVPPDQAAEVSCPDRQSYLLIPAALICTPVGKPCYTSLTDM